jgi:transposase InsO family protein
LAEIKVVGRAVRRRNETRNNANGWKGRRRKKRKRKKRRKVDSLARFSAGRRNRTRLPLNQAQEQGEKLLRLSVLPSHPSRMFRQYHLNLWQPMDRMPDTLSMWRERYIG